MAFPVALLEGMQRVDSNSGELRRKGTARWRFLFASRENLGKNRVIVRHASGNAPLTQWEQLRGSSRTTARQPPPADPEENGRSPCGTHRVHNAGRKAANALCIDESHDSPQRLRQNVGAGSDRYNRLHHWRDSRPQHRGQLATGSERAHLQLTPSWR